MFVDQLNERLATLRRKYEPLWNKLLDAIEANPEGFVYLMRLKNVQRIPDVEDIVARAIVAIQTAQNEVKNKGRTWKQFDAEFNHYLPPDTYEFDPSEYENTPLSFEELAFSFQDAANLYNGNLESFVSDAYRFGTMEPDAIEYQFDNIFGDIAKGAGEVVGGIFKGIGKAIKKRRKKKKKQREKNKQQQQDEREPTPKTQTAPATNEVKSGEDTNTDPDKKKKEDEKAKSKKTWLYVGIGVAVLAIVIAIVFVVRKNK